MRRFAWHEHSLFSRDRFLTLHRLATGSRMVKVTTSWEIDGKRVREGDLGRAVMASVVREIEQQIVKRGERIVCLVHNRSPEVIVMPSASGNIEFQVKGCCEAVIEEVKGMLRDMD